MVHNRFRLRIRRQAELNFRIVNTISVIMFIFCVILLFAADNLAIGISFSALWLLYTIVANAYLITQGKREEKALADAPIERLGKCDKRGLFRNEVQILFTQYNSISSRAEYMQKTTDSMQELYGRILEQAKSNMDSAAAYIESYDYYTRPEPVYLHNLCRQGDQLVQKFNILVEQLVDIDTNPTSLDMNYVDDVVECLQEMQAMQ